MKKRANGRWRVALKTSMNGNYNTREVPFLNLIRTSRTHFRDFSPKIFPCCTHFSKIYVKRRVFHKLKVALFSALLTGHPMDYFEMELDEEAMASD